MTIQARLGDTSADFLSAGVNQNEVALWEDGWRTNPDGENYEWWYFDTNLEDGSQLVVTFYAKSAVNPSSGLKPMIDIDLTKPDGTTISEKLTFYPEQFRSSKTSCDVQIGENYFIGDLNHYVIGVFSDKIKAKISFDNVTPAWRKNVAVYFGDKDENNFGWIPATPRGTANVELVYNNETHLLTGDCYHDHNWGDVALMKVMHHWYWGRANIDDYTVISSYMTTEKKYGYKKLPVFMLAKKEKILADDPNFMTYYETDKAIDEVTGKPFYKNVSYEYNDGQQHYKVSYLYEKTITQDRMIEHISGAKKAIAKLAGFDGAYLRFSGTVKLEIFSQSGSIETHKSKGLWEEMYFGKTLEV